MANQLFSSEKSTKFWSKICQKHGALEIIPNYEIIVQELKKERILQEDVKSPVQICLQNIFAKFWKIC